MEILFPPTGSKIYPHKTCPETPEMNKTIIVTPAAPKAIGPYSQAVKCAEVDAIAVAAC
jgi:hypothetical protein